MPAHYARSQVFSLTAVAQEPRTLFVCWDAAAFGSDKLNGKVGANVRAIIGWCLRATALEGGGYRDFAITPETGRCYLTGMEPGQTYQISLLLQDTVREKHLVCGCGPLTMPVAAVSDEEVAGWEISKETLAALCGGFVEASR